MLHCNSFSSNRQRNNCVNKNDSNTINSSSSNNNNNNNRITDILRQILDICTGIRCATCSWSYFPHSVRHHYCHHLCHCKAQKGVLMKAANRINSQASGPPFQIAR